MYTTRAGRDPEAVLELRTAGGTAGHPVMESTNADRLNFPMTHWAYGTGPAAKDADVLLVSWKMWCRSHLALARPTLTQIAWVTIDPVLSRYKTMEFRADLWIPAAVAAVARTRSMKRPHMLTQSALSCIADRRARLEQRKQEMVAQADAQAQEDASSMADSLAGWWATGWASSWSPRPLC